MLVGEPLLCSEAAEKYLVMEDVRLRGSNLSVWNGWILARNGSCP